MLHSQPPELVHAIIECIGDRPTLKSLRLVSRALHNEVDPFLYNTILLCDGLDHSLEARLEGLFERIAAPGSRIAPHVKHLTIRPYSSSSVYMKAEVLQSLSHILSHLCNLVSFSFECRTACFTESCCPIFHILANTRLPSSLRHLLWDHYDFGEASMGRVLNEMDNLERLELPWLQGRLDVSPLALSRLRILSCTADVAISLLPGRRITHLKTVQLKDGLTFSPEDKNAYARVRVYSGMGNWDSAFELASQMLALECLELSIHYISEPWYHALSRLIPRLEASQLSYIHITGYHSTLSSDVPYDIIKGCFDRLRTLKWIQLRNVGGSSYRVFDRWVCESPDELKTIVLDHDWEWICGWEGGYRMAERISEHRWC